MDQLPPILLLGGGRMGSAMLAGWRERGLSPSYVIDPAPAVAALAGDGVQIVADARDVPPEFKPAAVVLAVKPQYAEAAVPGLASFAANGAVVLSIMAGRTVTGLQTLLGADAPVVRAMPNTPAAIRQGITVACPGPGVTAAQRSLCDDLLTSVGEVAWVDDEGLIDAVTAVSGGGPAYVFLLAEELARAGIEAGLPEELATKLARETVAGSGELLHRSKFSSATLRQNVTSPGGTTAAALEVLMGSDGMQALLTRAVAAATRRSRQLAK